MQLKSVEIGEATITVPVEELRFLCNAINETLNAVSKREFKTRTRETPERAADLWQQLHNVVKAVREHEDRQEKE